MVGSKIYVFAMLFQLSSLKCSLVISDRNTPVQFCMNYISECEVIKPKSFREEIQLEVMEAYKKYWK